MDGSMAQSNGASTRLSRCLQNRHEIFFFKKKSGRHLQRGERQMGISMDHLVLAYKQSIPIRLLMVKVNPQSLEASA